MAAAGARIPINDSAADAGRARRRNGSMTSFPLVDDLETSHDGLAHALHYASIGMLGFLVLEVGEAAQFWSSFQETTKGRQPPNFVLDPCTV